MTADPIIPLRGHRFESEVTDKAKSECDRRKQSDNIAGIIRALFARYPEVRREAHEVKPLGSLEENKRYLEQRNKLARDRRVSIETIVANASNKIAEAESLELVAAEEAAIAACNVFEARSCLWNESGKVDPDEIKHLGEMIERSHEAAASLESRRRVKQDLQKALSFFVDTQRECFEGGEWRRLAIALAFKYGEPGFELSEAETYEISDLSHQRFQLIDKFKFYKSADCGAPGQREQFLTLRADEEVLTDVEAHRRAMAHLRDIFAPEIQAITRRLELEEERIDNPTYERLTNRQLEHIVYGDVKLRWKNQHRKLPGSSMPSIFPVDATLSKEVREVLCRRTRLRKADHRLLIDRQNEVERLTPKSDTVLKAYSGYVARMKRDGLDPYDHPLDTKVRTLLHQARAIGRVNDVATSLTRLPDGMVMIEEADLVELIKKANAAG